jgi:excisionase family DNA binding protein
MNNELINTLPYSHDVAEDIAWAQKPFIDIAHLAMQNATNVESEVLEGRVSSTTYVSNTPSLKIPDQDINDMLLTTTEAAVRLGISRPHLVNSLLNTGEIAFINVGRDRRIKFGEVMRYASQRDEISKARANNT